MKNPTTFITKDGVSDADLIRAARDMYEALDACGLHLFITVNDPFSSALYQKVCSALAKARGES